MKNRLWTNDEDSIIKEYYPKYGIDYCLDKLDRTKRSIQERRKTLKIKTRINVKNKYRKESLAKIVESSYTYTECLRKLGINNFGSSTNTLKKYIKLYNLNTNHFKNSVYVTIEKNTIPLEDILIEKSTYKNRTHLKERLYKEGLKERKCELCNQGEIWNDKKMSLILDHINGINNDNRIKNLRIVCPNCNATLPTHCRGNNNINN